MKNSKILSLLGRMDKLQRLFLVALFSVLAIGAHAQSKTVSGTVIDQTGEPVIGANVIVKGTTNGVITDLDGKFTLTNVPNNGTISVSFIGYKDQEISVAGKSNLNVTLHEDNAMLDEVVVVGYGVQKKSDVTGAIASVGAETLTARPVNNAFEALQGKAAGVDITTSERPGKMGDIRIRGNRSISASNAPLYVVDGVPLMSGSGIETLNPRDIESIDILKDASATAIYGSRGANGVVVVTTKQGKDGKFSLNYSGTLTVSNIVDQRKSMNAKDYIEYVRWAAYNSSPDTYAHPYSPTMENDKGLFDNALDNGTTWGNVSKGWANGTWDPSKVSTTDWTDFVTQTSLSHEHTLSASGGTEKMNAYLSFGYLDNSGTQKGQWYKRYSSKASINLKPKKWIQLSASINASWSEQDYGMSTLGAPSSSVSDALYGRAKALTSISVPYDAEGNIVLQPGGRNNTYTIIDEWNKSTQQSQTFRALGNFSATLDFGEMWAPLQGLRYKIAFGPDYRNWREGVFLDETSANRVGNGSYARLQNRRDFSWTLDNMVTFDRTLAEKHKFGVTLLQTASSWNYETSAMSAKYIARPSYLWNAFGTVDLADEKSDASMSSGLTERQLESYMVRLNYGFDERYLLTVSGRWDGASQLSEGNKWDFFPSASLAWRISQEDFMSNTSSWLDNLKLRLGFGVTGNSAVDPYSTLGKIRSILIPFSDGNYTAYTTNEPFYAKESLEMANPELGWEKTTQINLGVDFGFLNNRISGSIDAYWSKTNDLLMQTNIPTLTGFSTTYANIGKTKNRGVELTLNFIPIQTKTGFLWDSNFNVAWQKDEIVELAYGKNDMVASSWFIGESIGVYYGYDKVGLWQDTPEDRAEMELFNKNGHKFEPGFVRPVDQNGDHKIDEKDRVILGNKNPAWTMGWTNTFSWKNIELSLFLIGRMGYMVEANSYGLTGQGSQVEVDYWTPENTGAEFQKPYANESGGDAYSSLLGYRKASFLKVRNISLGYNFPQTTCKKIGLNNLKVYAQAINPGSLYQSIDKYDLDVKSSNFNRSFVFGLEIGF